MHVDRAQTEPAPIPSVDLHRREGDVSDEPVVQFSHEAEAQRARIAQSGDDVRLVAIGMRCRSKRARDQGGNAGGLGFGFLADCAGRS